MAEAVLNTQKIVGTLYDIVKRKMIYDETNLHYDYFMRSGETIPFKDFGYDTLRKFIEVNAHDFLYFENIADDLIFVAPKKQPKRELGESADYRAENPWSAKKIYSENIALNPSKRICVTSSIKYDPKQNDGKGDGKQKDVSISFNFGPTKKREDAGSAVQESDVRQVKEVHREQSSGRFVEKPLPMIPNKYDYASHDRFPWSEKYWHLKITNPSSINEIWARLYGEFENPEMNVLKTNLNKRFADKANRPNEHNCKEVYVVKHSNEFYRVKLLQVAADIDQCKCFLIDVGTILVVNKENIFACPNEIRTLPPMAIRFSLYGLSEFGDNRNARDILTKQLMDMNVWAKVKSNDYEYEYEKNKRPIPVVLYDSSKSRSRTNINRWIMHELIGMFSPPKLSPHDTNYMTISHISKTTGIIYCHVTSCLNDLRYVNNMIERYVSNGVARSFRKFSSSTDLHKLLGNTQGKLYLVYCEYGDCYYRATILQLETDYTRNDEFHTVHCFLVDYGNIRAYRLDNIYELSEALTEYPYLAVAVQLDGIKMTNDAYVRLKEVLMAGDSVMIDAVKIVNNPEKGKTKSIAFVKMMKFFPGHNKTKLCVINEII